MAALVHRQLDHLAVAVRTVVNIFDPKVVVLGGYPGTLHGLAPDRLPAALAHLAIPRPDSPGRIVPASLGENLLLVGAAQFALARTLRDPGGVISKCNADGERVF